MIDSAEYLIVNELSERHKQQLLPLYQNEWWSKNRSAHDVETILKGSSFVVGLVHKISDDLIGFARVLTDYFKYAYVYDVIIVPKYRGRDLGKYLIEQALNHPILKEVKYIELTCLEGMCSFYEQFGFTKDYNASVPMRRSNLNSTVS